MATKALFGDCHMCRGQCVPLENKWCKSDTSCLQCRRVSKRCLVLVSADHEARRLYRQEKADEPWTYRSKNCQEWPRPGRTCVESIHLGARQWTLRPCQSLEHMHDMETDYLVKGQICIGYVRQHRQRPWMEACLWRPCERHCYGILDCGSGHLESISSEQRWHLHQTQEENENLVRCAPATERPRVLLAEPPKVEYCLVEVTAIGEVRHQR